MLTRSTVVVLALASGLTSCNRRTPAATSVPEALHSVADMASPRAVHTATLLADGRVLIAGGCTLDSCDPGPASATSEIFDPRTERFTPGPALLRPRIGHTATRLRDGRVFLIGGWIGSQVTGSSEILDLATGNVKAGPDLASARGSHTATLLEDGRVLVVGGRIGPSGQGWTSTTEIFEPTTNRFASGPEMASPRGTHAAVRLGDGRVLVSGGARSRGDVQASAEVFDPKSNRFVPVGPMLVPRHKHALVALPDGGALVVAGSDQRDYDGKHASIERFDPATATFSSAGTLASPRFKLPDAVVALSDGSVLVAGGGQVPEMFDPQSRSATKLGGSLDKPWSFMTATALRDGRVLLAGGYEEGRIVVSARAWVYRPASNG